MATASFPQAATSPSVKDTVTARDPTVPDVEASFKIDQPPGRVWDFFQDMPEVVTCMPGTELLAQTAESTYKGKVTVKLGPVTAAFEGEATIAETDHEDRTARIEATGVDRRGGNRASASIAYEIHERDGGSHVMLYGSIRLSGALAQIGRSGIVQDVANHLAAQFSERLREKLARSGRAVDATADAQGSPQAIAGTHLARTIVVAWIRRSVASLFGRSS